MAAETKINITAVDKTQRAFSSVQTSLKKMTGAITTAQTAIAGLAAGFAVKEFTGFLDAATRIENRLKLVTKSSNELATAQASVLKIAQDTGSGLEDTADLYQRIATNAESLKLAQSDVATITDTVAKSIKISGSTAASAQGAIIQLGQALASGALRGEEFNSVNEQAPRIMKALADSLGVPRGELKKLAGEGKLTSDIVIKALLEQSKVISEEYGKTTTTVEDSFTKLKNTAIVLSGELDDQIGITDLLVDALNGLSDILVDLPQMFRDSKDELVALSAGLLTIAAPSIYATVSAGLIAIAGGIKAITLAMVSNPIGLVVAGLTSLAAYFISSNWGAVTEGFDDMKAKISGLSDEARTAEITRLSSKLEQLKEALQMQQLAEQSALGDAGKKARQENIASIQKQITKTEELIGLYKTAGKEAGTAAPAATPAVVAGTAAVATNTKNTLDLASAQLKADRIRKRLLEEQRARLEEQQRVQDFLAKGAEKVYGIAQRNSLVTGEASQASQDYFQSVQDGLALEAQQAQEKQHQLDLAKAIFLTNMEQGKYTNQQAFELASQLGLMNEMVALQQLNADRAFEAAQAKQLEADIEADLDAFLLERIKKQGKFNRLVDAAKQKFSSLNKKVSEGAGALVNNQTFGAITGAAGASGGRAMNIARATAEGGIQGGLMALVLSNAKVQEALGKVFDALFALIDPLIDLLVPALDALTPAIEELKPVFESLKPYFVALGAALKVQAVYTGQLFRGVSELVKVVESNTAFVRDFGKELEKIGPKVEQVGKDLEKFGQGFLDGIKTIGETLLNGVKAFIEGFGQALLDLPANIGTSVYNAIAGLPQAIYDAIKGLFDFSIGGGGGGQGLVPDNVPILGGLKNGGYISKAKGGMLVGQSHSSGGKIIEAEGGEFIFSREAVKRIGAARLNNMNNGMADYTPAVEVNIYDGTGQRISEYDSALRVEIKERAARNNKFPAVA